MLKQVRRAIVRQLWDHYHHTTPQIQMIEQRLLAKGIPELLLDHFAIIDLPGPHTGIPVLKNIFSALGFAEQGHDYLPEKQNDFLWMTEVDSVGSQAQDVLP